MNDRDRLEQRLRQALDEQDKSLDPTTLTRLRQVRSAAIDKAGRKALHGHSGVRQWAVPAGAFATLFAVAIGVSVWLRGPTPEDDLATAHSEPATLVEMVAADVDIDLLEEIEFYDWLTLMQTNGDSA